MTVRWHKAKGSRNGKLREAIAKAREAVSGIQQYIDELKSDKKPVNGEQDG